MEVKARYHGCLLGLAVGDALGATLEFSSPGSFEPIFDMIGGGQFSLKPGEWTDDTSMTLCLAESLIEREGFDPVDQLKRYIKWMDEGHLSSNGKCFDVGTIILYSLAEFTRTKNPYCGPVGSRSAGNGSLMRLAPIPLFYAAKPEMAINMSGESSRTTHQAKICIDACRYYGGLIVGALLGISKDYLLSKSYSPVKDIWEHYPLNSEIKTIADGSFKDKNPPEIIGSGFVVDSMEAALWAYYKSQSFEEGCLMAINLGNDSDTTGAIYGQLAGAFYGEHQIPERWLSKLAHKNIIVDMADKLLTLSRTDL